MSAQTCFSQTLSDYRWEKRLIVLLTKSEQGEELTEQLRLLQPYQKQMEDRKIQLLQVSPSSIKDDHSSPWRDNGSQIYDQYTRGSNPFQVILIGLDGGIKLRQYQPIDPEEIFALIDTMPMRRAEMERKRN